MPFCNPLCKKIFWDEIIIRCLINALQIYECYEKIITGRKRLYALI